MRVCVQFICFIGCPETSMLSVSVCVMQNKLVAVVQDSLDVMQKKMVHNIKDFTSLDVSFVCCTQ